VVGLGALKLAEKLVGSTCKNLDGGIADPLITMCGAESRLREKNISFSWVGQPPEGFVALRVDSRNVHPGDLFCALSGSALDGHAFIENAAAAGAVAAIVEQETEAVIPTLRVSDSRAAAAHVASFAAGDPASDLKVIGVTGTNGKTTTVLLLRHLLGGMGKAAALGTLGLFMPNGSHLARARMTTPGPIDLTADIKTVAGSGADFLAMEVSSHALDQRRVEALQFSVALFTNLSHEHLDYHPDMDSYRQAKLRLVDLLLPDGTAVINAEDPAWKSSVFSHVNTLTYGQIAHSDVRAEDVCHTPEGSRWTLITPDGNAPVALPLLGDFNVSNALGAAAAAHALGADTAAVASRLASAPQVSGRMEVLARSPGPLVVRDYAHTPDGLRRALEALRSLTRERLTVVFGCGGDRDRAKRPLMGEAATSAADRVIVTTDNPRMEDPHRIVEDITAGLSPADFEVMEDRTEAIEQAILPARVGDVVLLAGKGHETYQDIRGTKYPFDEVSIVSAVTERLT